MSSKSRNCLDQFGFSHDKPELFRVSQWGDTRTLSTWYLCYRTLLALVYTSIYFTLWIYDLDLNDKWLLYLTNQSMLLLVVHLLLDMFLALKTHNKQKDEKCLR